MDERQMTAGDSRFRRHDRCAATPMLRQYFEIKKRYPDPDTILFFRLGDFYEMFFDDAETASRILDIALTSRNRNDENPVPLCGVPFHSADGYIAKLLENGKKVAICEQLEDPALAKGIVKREVVRVITPGTVTELETLDQKSHNFLAAVWGNGVKRALAFVDLTTGLFKVEELNSERELIDEISRIEPSEILVGRSNADAVFAREERIFLHAAKTIIDDAQFDPEALDRCFRGRDFPIFAGVTAIAGMTQEVRAAVGAIINYVKYTAPSALRLIKEIEVVHKKRFMMIDEAAQRNLELTRTMMEGGRYGSLLWVLDKTETPMGARLLREWLLNPLMDVDEIKRRQDAVAALVSDVISSEEISGELKKVADIERLAGRIAMESALPRELITLADSLKVLPILREKQGVFPGLLKEILGSIDPLDEVIYKIETTIVDDPPQGIKDGGIIRAGFSRELDELRAVSGEGKGFIAALETKERARTGIGSLKVGFNRVFGYYIEITHTHRDKIPADYIRKQTLTNAERFITPELKSFEEKVMGADEKSKALEYEIYRSLRHELGAYLPRMRANARVLAILDAILSLAIIARDNRYVRPDILDSAEIDIKDGRHPIIEKISTYERFVPNDIYLNGTDSRLIIITGPNMAGKSTIMRQAALITLMAQMGSFIPASSARIGVVDRIFTRVGASDNIMRGQSTFMVEMQEASLILSEATEKSLIIIDEIGRGTSTFDGLAIAWAIAEHIHDNIKAKTLFATHYHELTDLAITKQGAKNFNVAVKEWKGRLIFLHKMVPGGVSHSYGIQVAELAGLPPSVVARAREVLTNLEKGEFDEVGQPALARPAAAKKREDVNQLHLFAENAIPSKKP